MDKERILDLVRRGLAELLGTGILVGIGCMSCANTATLTTLNICLIFGLGILVAVQCFAHISGSNINPILSMAALINGHLDYIECIVYCVSQMIGGIMGFAVVKLITPSQWMQTPNNSGMCVNHPGEGISIFQAMGVEIIISALLTFFFLAVLDPRNAHNMDSIPIKFGLAIGGLAMAAVPYSGASMNPARSFAPSLLENDWEDHWIYWVGPIIGALISSVLYRFVFAIKKGGDGDPA